MSRRYTTYDEAFAAAVYQANRMNRPIELARVKEYGRDGYNVRTITAADPVRGQVVQPGEPLTAAQKAFTFTYLDPVKNGRRRNGKRAFTYKPGPVNAAVVATARAAGRAAYARGGISAPAKDPQIMRIVKENAGDSDTIIAALDAWTKEWHKAHRAATDHEVAKLGVFRRNATNKVSRSKRKRNPRL